MLDVCWYDRPDTGERRLEMANSTWSPHEGRRSLRWETGTEESPSVSRVTARQSKRKKPVRIMALNICCL